MIRETFLFLEFPHRIFAQGQRISGNNPMEKQLYDFLIERFCR